MVRDNRYENFQGSVQTVKVNTGPGSFKPGSLDDDSDDDSVLGYKTGVVTLIPKVQPVTVNTQNAKFAPAASGDPVLEVAHPGDKLPSVLNEYGYGFWYRYLTHYPERLWSGKNAPWYFVSRLSMNEKPGDVAFGDRLLSLF